MDFGCVTCIAFCFEQFAWLALEVPEFYTSFDMCEPSSRIKYLLLGWAKAEVGVGLALFGISIHNLGTVIFPVLFGAFPAIVTPEKVLFSSGPLNN